MRILDMSAGKRCIWMNRMHEDTVYVDMREEVNPTICADTRCLPFKDSLFDLIVFDPPHMVHGKTSSMGKAYGVFTAREIQDTIIQSSNEAFRCSTEDAFMAFKWNDHDVRLDHVLPWMEGWEPLFGHNLAAGRRSTTSWVLLRKRRPGYQPVGAIQRVLQMMQERSEES